MSQCQVRLAGVTESRLLLLDGHSLAYRAFFALPVENFSTSSGQPTNAVYGFTSMVINLLRDEKPTHIAVAFDVSRKSFRTEQYPEYKAGRSESPADFRGQVELIREVMVALRIPVFSVENFEADDIIATLAAHAQADNMPTLISSGDRDSYQLVTDSCTVLYPKKGVSDLARMTPDAVREKYGVGPQQYRELAALVGEQSDNLPGVPGVGPKTAAKWLNLYGSLDELVARVDEIKGKAGENLRAHLADVLRNHQLNGLIADMPLDTSIDDLHWQGWDREAVHELFDSLQFRVLRDRLTAALPSSGEHEPAEPAPELQGTIVGPGELENWLEQYGTQPLALAAEGSWGSGKGTLTAVALATAEGHAAWFDTTQLTPQDDAALATWLSDNTKPKIGHDIKGLMLALHAHGWPLAGLQADTALQAYLIRPDQRTYDLADLCLRYLQRELATAGDNSGQLSFDGIDELKTRDALMARAAATAELAEALDAQVAQAGGTALMRDIELPLLSVLAEMERIGVAADAHYLAELEAHFAAEVKSAEQAAHAVVGHDFNLGSPKQLQAVLFDELGLPKTKRIKTGYTTDAESLQNLFVQTNHPLLEHLLRFRDVAKLKSTVNGLLKTVADDGRIHTTFNQLVAATGRLSSADPNLQNIPIRTDEGRRIRHAFVVGKDAELLLTADYSQIELRIMAHLSADAGLIDAFSSGEDLHTTVGSRIFSVEPDQVDADMRRKVKAMSYGLAYGLSEYGLSQQLGIAPGEARDLMNEFFERFGGVRDYLRDIVEQARLNGYTETLFGRRRYLPDLTSDNRQRREMAERMALNAPIQGSAADIIKVAMLRVDAALAKENLQSRMLLQVHDELVLEVAPGEASVVEELVRREMAGAHQLTVPLDVSVGTGANWDAAGH
ncbi:MAG: DNA polymerase I [Corynebacteriales bacterium]|nr:DNA polymerase I [Mycobacteriales bacterium]